MFVYATSSFYKQALKINDYFSPKVFFYTSYEQDFKHFNPSLSVTFVASSFRFSINFYVSIRLVYNVHFIIFCQSLLFVIIHPFGRVDYYAVQNFGLVSIVFLHPFYTRNKIQNTLKLRMIYQWVCNITLVYFN